MIINDSDGFPINTIHMDDLAKQYGTPMFQGVYRLHTRIALPLHCLMHFANIRYTQVIELNTLAYLELKLAC